MGEEREIYPSVAPKQGLGQHVRSRDVSCYIDPIPDWLDLSVALPQTWGWHARFRMVVLLNLPDSRSVRWCEAGLGIARPLRGPFLLTRPDF